MGQDKAQLIYRGETLLKRALRCLQASGCASVAVSVANPAPPIALPQNCECWQDRWQSLGPIGGIFTAIEHMGDKPLRFLGLIIMPVDLPRLHPEVIHLLIKHCAKGHRAAYFAGSPLPCALLVDEALMTYAQNLPKQSMAIHRFLAALNPAIIDPDAAIKSALFNANTPQAWKELNDEN